MTKRDKIKLLLQTINMTKGPESGFRSLVSSLPDDKIPRLAKIKHKYLKRFDEMAESTYEKRIDLYDRLLSEAAIDASILFYSSLEGQEIVSKLEALNDGFLELAKELTFTFAKDFLTELIELEPTDEEMTAMGFVKIATDVDDLSELFNPDHDLKKTKKKKIIPHDSPDEISDEELDRFMKDHIDEDK